MIPPQLRTFQIPLIEFVDSDDSFSNAKRNILWFDLLRDLDWRPTAALRLESIHSKVTHVTLTPVARVEVASWKISHANQRVPGINLLNCMPKQVVSAKGWLLTLAEGGAPSTKLVRNPAASGGLAMSSLNRNEVGN